MIDLGVLSLVIVFMVMLWAVMLLSYVVFDQRKENKELRKENKELCKELARYTQPQPPEWLELFRPSDPRIGALN